MKTLKNKDDEFLDKLPESLQTIIKLTDVSTALTLVNHYGGTELHFPPVRRINAEHELAVLIGFNNLKQLCQYYNNDKVYISKADHYSQFLRDEKIRQDAATLGTAELAKKYGISDRWVRAIKSRQKPACVKKKEVMQIDLFE